MSVRCWSTTLRWLVYHEQYIYHSSGTSILQETSPGLSYCDSDAFGKESESLTEPQWVTTPAPGLRKGCYGDHGQTCNNYGSLATDFKECHCKLSYSSSTATCVKFALPFMAGLVLSVFSFSAEIKLIQRDGKILSHSKAPDWSPPDQKAVEAPFGVMSIRYTWVAGSQSRWYSWHSGKTALQHQPLSGA